MTNRDPVALLLEMVTRVTQREPKRLVPGELWEFTKILVAVAEQRPDYVASLSTDDQQLFRVCTRAALEGFTDIRVH